MTAPQSTRKPQQQTALIRRPSLAEQQSSAAQQAQELPVTRSMPLNFGDC